MSLRFKSMAELNAHIQQARGPLEVAQPKRKYGNEPVQEDGYKFDSKFEAQRYRELKAMQACGLISCLRVHTSFGLHVNGKRIGAICPDFDYRSNGSTVVEDVKSPVSKTPLYEWKKNHFRVEYGLEIVEIMRNKRRAA